MEYSQAPLRNLDTVNATTFNLNDDSKLIRNSKRVLFDAPPPLADILNARLLPVKFYFNFKIFYRLERQKARIK